jgi:hypothetical protein
MNMNILGLDIGFSTTRATSSFCLLSLDLERAEVELIERPQRFGANSAQGIFQHLSRSYEDIGWISVDAPLTPERIVHRPKSGRSVDKRFSRGRFIVLKEGRSPAR